MTTCGDWFQGQLRDGLDQDIHAERLTQKTVAWMYGELGCIGAAHDYGATPVPPQPGRGINAAPFISGPGVVSSTSMCGIPSVFIRFRILTALAASVTREPASRSVSRRHSQKGASSSTYSTLIGGMTAIVHDLLVRHSMLLYWYLSGIMSLFDMVP